MNTEKHPHNAEHEHLHLHQHETKSPYEQAFAKHNLHLHEEKIAADAHRIIENHYDENDTADVRRSLIGMMDVTSLRVTDNDESILRLVEDINKNVNNHPDIPAPAAVCTYPNFAHLVSQSLEAEDTAIAVVAGGFPSSQMLPEVKTVETSLALKDGATEIDTVFPVGQFLSEDYEGISLLIDELKDIVGDERKLKVILETGVLGSPELIKKAAILSIYSGADFIKTSTGKIQPGATPEAIYVMCDTVKEYFDQTGRKIGIKAAGGISTVRDAIAYYTIVKEILGAEWLTPELFRIGTSHLYKLLFDELSDD